MVKSLNIHINLCLFSIVTTFFCLTGKAQNEIERALTDIKSFQQELNHEYADSKESPLKANDLAQFEGLPFFPVDLKYRIVAKFIRTKHLPSLTMATTTDRKPVYDKFGEAHFELNGSTYVLSFYQSHKLRKTEAYSSYLFLPFTDNTNGISTYGGGRFIDLSIPDGDTILIDFNKAYNPYCAYNAKYSCPIPPAENDLDIDINAGVMAFK